MEIQYDKSALQEYIDDTRSVGELLRHAVDESFFLYNSCKQYYTRLYTELEQVNRKAYNRVESAESMRRSADAEYDLAIRMLENARDNSEQEAARRRLQYAQTLRAEAEREMSEASAEYAKSQVNMKSLTDVWEKYQLQLECTTHKVEDGFSLFSTVASNGNRDLNEYIEIMDKAQMALYEDSGKASVSSGNTHGVSAQNIKYVTIPYDITLPSGEKEWHTYDLPIVYDRSMPHVPQGTLSFGDDTKAAAEWAGVSFSDWRANLSEDSKEAILVYSSTNEYEEINGVNRGNIPMTEGLKRISDSIDAGINNSVLSREMIVYRAVSEAAIVDMALKAGGKLESGVVLEDQGFLSTSLVSDTNFTRDKNYIMRLTALPGLHGAPLEYGKLSRIPGESEMLFGRNHNIYVRNVVEARRCDIIPNSNEDLITIIDGVLTI